MTEFKETKNNVTPIIYSIIWPRRLVDKIECLHKDNILNQNAFEALMKSTKIKLIVLLAFTSLFLIDGLYMLTLILLIASLLIIIIDAAQTSRDLYYPYIFGMQQDVTFEKLQVFHRKIQKIYIYSKLLKDKKYFWLPSKAQIKKEDIPKAGELLKVYVLEEKKTSVVPDIE